MLTGILNSRLELKCLSSTDYLTEPLVTGLAAAHAPIGHLKAATFSLHASQ